MLPLDLKNTVISSIFNIADFLYPRNKSYPLTESWELGGKAIQDTSEELTKYVWKCWYEDKAIYYQRVDTNDIYKLMDIDNVTELDLTFDQNMQFCLTYVSNNISYIYWFDTAQDGYVTDMYEGIRNPRVSLDDKRRFNVSDSDIIFAYMKDNNLCYRQQRERFTKEYVLKSYQDKFKRILWRIGMGRQHRFLFYVR